MMRVVAFIVMLSLIGFCFYLMYWESGQHKIAADICAQHGLKPLGGRDYTLCFDPNTKIVYYLK